MSSAVGTASSAIRLPDHVQRLFVDARTQQIPRVQQTSSLDDGDVERELHDTLRRIDGALQVWAMDVVDLGRTAAERHEWEQVVRDVQAELVALRKQAAQALVAARQRQLHAQPLLSAQQARKALLSDMAGSKEERQRRRDERISNQTADEQLMTASGDVTTALQRAVQLMSTELEKSSYSAQLLDESSVTMQQATLQYTSFSTLMTSSRKLIASMERADMWDAAMLVLSFTFFAGCILYILKVRIWDRGVGLLSFVLRLFGFMSNRSPADVKEKLALVKAAAQSSSSAFAAQMTASAQSIAAAAAAARSSSTSLAAQMTASALSASSAAAAAASSSAASVSAAAAEATSAVASTAKISKETDSTPPSADTILFEDPEMEALEVGEDLYLEPDQHAEPSYHRAAVHDEL